MIPIAPMGLHAAFHALLRLQAAVHGPYTVVFGGDVVPHTPLLAAFDAHGPAALYAPIAPVLRAADLAFVNFETPAAPTRPLSPDIVRFNVHADFARALADAGVDGAAIANNHSFDAGISGVGETVATLRASGLRVVGGALPGEDPLAPQRFALGPHTLCVFAATRLLNFDMRMPGPSEPRIGLARRDPPEEQQALLERVGAARAACDAVIVSLHTGVEYEMRAEEVDRIYFHRLAEAGADAVVAHHSHTAQPVELYTTRDGRHVPIFDSLGNFLSNQGYAADADLPAPPDGHLGIAVDPRLREGLLAVFRFAPSGERLALDGFGFVPLWTVNTYTHVRARSVPVVSAALFPRDGDGDRVLRLRWRALVARIGRAYLLPEDELPGADAAYAASDAAVRESRGRAVTAMARGGP